MNDGARRSIRDIAHLYISTAASSRAAARRRLVVAGTDRECFPGFHAANLAAALCGDAQRVRIIERSRLLLNCARFLALPPQVYAAVTPVPSAAALDRLEVWFASPHAETGPGTDLIHAPPLDDRAAFERCRRDFPGAPVLIVARRPADVPDDLGGGAAVSILLIEAPADGKMTSAVAATVTRWRRSLRDPLPATVRDRGSHLSRAYHECARRIAGATPFPRSAHVDHAHDIDRRAGAR